MVCSSAWLIAAWLSVHAGPVSMSVTRSSIAKAVQGALLNRPASRTYEGRYLAIFHTATGSGPAGLVTSRSEIVAYFVFAGSSQGTMGIKFVEGLASGDARRTAMAPRSAPVKEWVTSG